MNVQPASSSSSSSDIASWTCAAPSSSGPTYGVCAAVSLAAATSQAAESLMDRLDTVGSLISKIWIWIEKLEAGKRRAGGCPQAVLPLLSSPMPSILPLLPLLANLTNIDVIARCTAPTERECAVQLGAAAASPLRAGVEAATAPCARSSRRRRARRRSTSSGA